jgi:hypothetical protein
MTSPSFYTDTTGRTASRREIADIGGAVRLRPGVILMPEEGMARIIESLGRSA